MLSNHEAKEILSEVITPLMNSFGLNNYDGNFIWSSDFNNEGIKHVFQYHFLKGYSASFCFGNKYYNRKELDYKLSMHLFERELSWKDSFISGKKQDFLSHKSENKLRKSLKKKLKIEGNRMETWWKKNRSISENLITAKRQTEHLDVYGHHFPSPSDCFLELSK